VANKICKNPSWRIFLRPNAFLHVYAIFILEAQNTPKFRAFFCIAKNQRHDATFQTPKLHLNAIFILPFKTAPQSPFQASKIIFKRPNRFLNHVSSSKINFKRPNRFSK